MGNKEIEVQNSILLIVHSNGDELQGRTILQKLAYFWTNYISTIKDTEFKHHYYGPYSSEVREALAESVTSSYMSEETTSGMIYEKYKYKITEYCKENIIGKLEADYKNEFELFKKLIKTCKGSNKIKYDELTYAAKIHYIRNKMSKDETESTDNIIKRARLYGWVVEREKFQNGADLLKKIDHMYMIPA